MNALLGNRALFTLTVEGCDEELRVVRFRGHEGVSSLFELRVEVACVDALQKPLIGGDALLTIDGLSEPRHIHGFVCQVEYIGDAPRHILYELTIVPWIWRLQQRAGCRIFQQQTTPQILARVLEGAGLARSQFRLELRATYAPRDYCVQYGESDLDFLHRLMEADGIIYHFEHSESQHLLVLTDRPDCGPPPDGAVELTWGPATGGVHDREHVTRFRVSELMRPERVSLRDRNLNTPAVALEASEGAGTGREIYEYPGSYQQLGKKGPHQGELQARLRLEALQAAQRRGFGTTDSPRLIAGCAFTLTGHRWPLHDGEYRVLGLAHTGEQPQALDGDSADPFQYHCDFECMAVAVPYRAPRVTPRPTIRGVQTATVVGPAGEEIFVDSQGRVKVEFHWDRRDSGDDSSSCWVRVSQAWAGNGFGAMFLPWIGHEVLVDFIEGDPDRPIITGRVYTGDHALPYPLPDEKTKSTIKSESSPGGGGFNELRFEDARGSEEVFLHAQKDLTVAVLNDASTTIGHDLGEAIKHDRTIKVDNNHTEQIGVDMKLKVGANLSEEVGTDMRVTVGANLNEDVSGAMATRVTGNITTSSGQNIVLDAGKHLTITTGENVNISSGAKTAVVVGDKLTIQCGAATVTITSAGAVSIKAASLDISASGAVTVKGASIALN